MPDIRFIYQSDDYCEKREIVSTIVCEIVSTELSLPDKIEIVFAKLNESEYGSTFVNPRFPNRLSVNTKLTFMEIPHVLVHELIHLYQIKTGMLSSTSDGKYIWNSKIYTVPQGIDYIRYIELPWESDVAKREPKLLAKVLEILNAGKI